MLNRLPKHPGTWTAILADIGNPSPSEIAKALGVSRRTVDRWTASEAPKIARLSLWWLSCEGHSVWDSEMHQRTQLALGLNDALWSEVRLLRAQLAKMARAEASPQAGPAAANDRMMYA